MTTFEEYLKSKTGADATATRQRPTTPAVIRRSDVMKTGFDAPAPKLGSLGTYQQPKPEGFMGFLQDIMDSPVGKVVTKAGEVISLPGRAITSGIKEIYDAVDGDPNTNASWGDFSKQVADPTFGFGSVIGDATDSAWWNRIIGFAGDVLLDPLTYVTFGGNQALKYADDVSKIGRANKYIGKGFTSAAGRKGREALAVRVLDVLEDADLAARVAKRGRAALSHLGDDAFEQLGLNRAGVYFMGKRIKGTEKVGQFAENGLTNMRTWTGEHVYKRMADIFTEDDILDARKALRGGYAPPERAETYLRMVISENQQRAEKAVATREFNASLETLIQDIGEEQFRTYSPTIHRLLEGEDMWTGPNAKVPSTPEEFVAKKIAVWFKDRWEEIDRLAKDVDPLVEMGQVEKYFPHVLTDDARRWITSNESPAARELRELVFNPLNDAGSFKPRMTFGDKFFGTKLGPVETRTVKNMNEIARRSGFKGDFFETDAVTAMRKYGNNYAQQRGAIARRKYIVDNGVLDKIPTVIKRNPEAIKETRRLVTGVVKGREKALKDTKGTIGKIRSTLDTYGNRATSAIDQRMGAVTARVADATEAVAVSNANIHNIRESLRTTINALQQQQGTYQAMYDSVPFTVHALENRLDDLVKELVDVESNIDVLSKDAVGFGNRMAELEARATSVAETEALLASAGEIIEAHLDDIISGRKPSVSKDAVRARNALHSVFQKDSNKKLFKRQKKALEEFTGTADAPGQLFDNATIAGDIKPSQVTRLSYPQVRRIVEKAATGEASLGELRTAAMWYQGIFDGDLGIPGFADEFAEGGLMARAASADQYHRALTSAASKDKKVVRLVRQHNNARNARIDFSDAVYEYVAAKRMLAELFGDRPSSIGSQVSKAMLDADPYGTLESLLARSEYAYLDKYFSRFLQRDEVFIQNVSSEITGDNILQRLNGIVDTFAQRKIAFGSEAVKPTGEAVSAGKVVYMRDYQATLDYMLKYSSDTDIDDIVSLAVSGKLSSGDDLPGMAAIKASRSAGRGRPYTGGQAIPDVQEQVRGGVARLESQIAGIEAAAEQRKLLAGASKQLGDVEGGEVLEFAAKFEEKFMVDAIRDTIKELMLRNVAANSIDGEIAKVTSALRKLDVPVRTDLGERLAEEVIPDMQSLVTRMSFHFDVHTRIYSAGEALASVGLTMPDSTISRIVNNVAKEHLAGVQSTGAVRRQAATQLEQLLERARGGYYANSTEMFIAIEQAIADNNLSGVITRYVGQSDAERILQESAKFGGKRMDTKAWRDRIENLRLLEEAANNPALDDAARAAAARKYKTAMKKPGMLKQRTAYFNETLVPWYESVFGKQTKKPTYDQVFDALGEYAAKARGNMTPKAIAKRLARGEEVVKGSRLGHNVPIADMSKWLEDTIGALTQGRSYRVENELRRATDPFFRGDAKSITHVGPTTPSTVAFAISKLAQDIADMSEEIAGVASKSAAKQEAIGTFMKETGTQANTLRAVIEAPIGGRGAISARAADELMGLEEGTIVAVREQLRRVVEMKNSAAYHGAVRDKEFNDFLDMFADLDIVEPTNIQYRMSVKSQIREAIESGKVVAYVEAEAGSVTDKKAKFLRWQTVESVDEIPDDVLLRHEQGHPIVKIGYIQDRTLEKTGKLRLVDPETAAARSAERKAKLIAEAEELESNSAKLLAAGEGDASMIASQEAAKKRQRAERIIVNAPESRGFQDIANSPDVVMFGRGLARDGVEAEITKAKAAIRQAQSDMDTTPRPLQGTRRLRDETKGEVESRVAKATEEFETNSARLAELESEATRTRNLVDDNDNPIVLTGRDVEALFNTTTTEKVVRGITGDIRILDKRRIAIEQSIITGKINSVTAQILEQESIYDDALSSLIRIAGREPGTTIPLGSFIGNHQAARRVLQDELNRLNRQVEYLDGILAASTKEARNEALSKVRMIKKAVDDGRITMDELEQGMSKIGRLSPWQAEVRRFEVTDRFASSKGGKLLDEIAEIEEGELYAIAQNILRDAQSSDRIVSELRSQASKFDSDISVLTEGGIKRGAFGREETIVGLQQKEQDLMSLLGKATQVSEGQYDALARYTELTTVGVAKGKSKKLERLSHSEAIDTIVDEMKQVRPPGEKIGSASTAAANRELTDIRDALATLRDAQDVVRVDIDVNVTKRAALKSDIKTIKGELDKTRKAWARDVQKPRLQASRKEIVALEKKRDSDAIALFEAMWASPSIKGHLDETTGWATSTTEMLNSNKERIVRFLDEVGKRSEAAAADEKMIPHLLDFLDESEEVLRLIDDINPSTGKPLTSPSFVAESPLLVGLRADLLNSYNGLLASRNAEAVIGNIQRALDDGTFGQLVGPKVSDGYVSLKHVGLPSYQAEEWLSEMFTNLNRIQMPAYSRYLSKFLGKYTGFFKAYAVSTPGFVVRNAISNTFMLFAGGVEVRNMGRGLELYSQWRKAISSGREAQWIASLGEGTRDVVQRAIQATDASGYGRAQDALMAFNPKRRWLVDNKWVNFIRTKNDLVDGSARFIMAYDSVLKGGDFNQATARVKRYFFDYESISAGDEFMRGIIPFWFWMSRNLPMQIANMYQNPRAYLMFNKGMKAVGLNDDGDIVPSYLQEQGAVKIGDNWYFAPDVGFNRVSQQFNELTDPMRLLSYVNPGLRVPIELMGNRKFYNDQPFWDKGQNPVGQGIGLGAPVQALAALLGQTAETDEGSVGVTDKVNYGLTNLIPLLAQTERLIPSTEYGKGRQAGSTLGWLGFPFRQVTDQSREAELRRRERESNQ